MISSVNKTKACNNCGAADTEVYLGLQHSILLFGIDILGELRLFSVLKKTGR